MTNYAKWEKIFASAGCDPKTAYLPANIDKTAKMYEMALRDHIYSKVDPDKI